VVAPVAEDCHLVDLEAEVVREEEVGEVAAEVVLVREEEDEAEAQEGEEEESRFLIVPGLLRKTRLCTIYPVCWDLANCELEKMRARSLEAFRRQKNQKRTCPVRRKTTSLYQLRVLTLCS
jgi:hypothetical protein